MKSKFIYILLSVCIAFTACKKSMIEASEVCNLEGGDSSLMHPNHSVYQNILEKYKKRGLPGVAVLIHDEHGVWMGSAGKADIDKGVDFKPCTVSKVASITKMIFAAAIMQLREQGKVNLDDKVSKWLDESLISKVKNADKATLRDLMQHSSGIYDIITDSDFYLAILNNPNKKWSGEDLLKFAENKPATFDYKVSARSGAYSNTNTLLMSLCIEKITGKSHHLWMKELVFDKLGMNNTYYHHYDNLPKSTAQGYYDLYNNGSIVNVSNLITGSGNGYGGVYSNVQDLHKFMKALFIDKVLVNQQSLDIMTQFIADDERTELGVGLLKQFIHLNLGHSGIGHSGRDLGYSGDAHYFPTKNNRILINLVNYGTNGNTPLRQVFYDMRDEFAKEMMK